MAADAKLGVRGGEDADIADVPLGIVPYGAVEIAPDSSEERAICRSNGPMCAFSFEMSPR